MKIKTIKLKNLKIKLIDNKNVFMPSKRSILLARFLTNFDFLNKKILDVGTGTGFLAIVCALQGASEVVAIDNNVQSLISTRNNWNLNDLDTKLTVITSDVFEEIKTNNFKENFDFIICNPPGMPSAIIDQMKFKSFESWLLNSSGKDGRLVLDRLLKDATFFLKTGGILVFIHSSRLGFNKTKNILDKNLVKWSILHKQRFELEKRFLPFVNFWGSDRGKIFQNKNRFFEEVKIIKATKLIAK